MTDRICPSSLSDMTPFDRLKHIGWIVTEQGCWEWAGTRLPKGYGQISINGKRRRAHVLMYEVENGPVADGLVVRHKCDNPPCVNPEHLEVGTVADNTRDMLERGRDKSYASGWYGDKCAKGLHDISTPGALFRVKGQNGRPAYQCRECRREGQRRYRARIAPK